MTAPNRNTLWARVIVDELAKAGLERMIIAPGSRSTPLTLAADRDDRIQTFSHLDERSAGFFALGQGKRTGTPTAVLSTSGTAAVNFHPAVVEAHQSRTPLVVLSADRPPELQDSGANQTIDQSDLYGDAPRFARTLPEPEPTAGKLRSLRTTIDRAVGASRGTNPGPVHLNVPFRKPLPPIEVPADVPADLATRHPEAVTGRDGPFVDVHSGRVRPAETDMRDLQARIEDAERGLLVAGPTNADRAAHDAIVAIANATGFPVLADPLSGLRFGPHVNELPVIGGYDGYIGSDAVDSWPTPDLVIRFGASPTSKPLRHYLRDLETWQVVVDPAGGWREATFTTNELLEADEQSLAAALEGVSRNPTPEWHDRFQRAEQLHRELVDSTAADTWEGGILHSVAAMAPDPSTVFVSNSMPVRDLDRYARPSEKALTVLGNRGASGIDGIASTGLGAGSVTDDPLVVVTGDLAYFHDMNGLLALGRFGLDAIIVVINNDGGGIFHMLPIEDFDPPFERQFVTPHGLDFSGTEDLYELDFTRVTTRDEFETRFDEAVTRAGAQVIEYETDAEASHRIREQIAAAVAADLRS